MSVLFLSYEYEITKSQVKKEFQPQTYLYLTLL